MKKVFCGIGIKDEAWILPRLLRILETFCHKIIIQDDGSTDASEEICKSFKKVKWYARPKHDWWKREEGKQRREIFDLTTKNAETGDFILLLDADELPTPSIIPFLEKRSTNSAANTWSIRMINLWNDESHYRVDQYTTSNGTQIRWDPFLPNAWRKTCLFRYDDTYDYQYDLRVEKGPVSKFHPCADNTQEPIEFTDEFYLLHYGKISELFQSGKKNQQYAEMEAYEGRGSVEKRLQHHEACRTEGVPTLIRIPDSWFWDFPARHEQIIKGQDQFQNEKGTIDNYYTNDVNINWFGLIRTKNGSVRSNHYHPVQTQRVLIVQGGYVSKSKDLTVQNAKVNSVTVCGGDLLITPNLVAHVNLFTEDTVSINLVESGMDRDSRLFAKHTVPYKMI